MESSHLVKFSTSGKEHVQFRFGVQKSPVFWDSGPNKSKLGKLGSLVG